MSWKDKDGNELEAGDTVIVEGKISGRHSGDQISVEIAPGQRVLIDAATCSTGKAPQPSQERQPKPKRQPKQKLAKAKKEK